jgi:hypothetical protein
VNTERKLVTIREVSDLQPIPGADAIEVATVDGWKCVVKKNIFSVGDWALYFEIDSILPIGKPQFDFLTKGVKSHRLKTIRLRKQLSQGLLLPIDDFPELQTKLSNLGQDATALLDATGHVAIGGVNVGGRDLLLDAAMLYEDIDALAALGFDLEELGAPAADLTFASRVAGDTQFFAQSTNLGGLLEQTFSFLNVAGAIMENDASTGYFGLEGYVNDKMGATLKAAMGFGLAAATGLNIDSDVIDVLEGRESICLCKRTHCESSRWGPFIDHTNTNENPLAR